MQKMIFGIFTFNKSWITRPGMGTYRRNPTLGRWVKGQRERYKKNKEKMLAGDADAAAYMNSDRIKKLESIGFCFVFDTRTSCDSTYDINDLPDLMEGFIHLEQSDQELDESNGRLLHNARTLFDTVEEVRKNCRSTSATADNSAPARCGLGDLNSDTLENIIEFFQEGDDWKQKMSLVCTNWRRVVLRLDSCTIYDLSTADLLNVFSWLELPEVVKASQTCHKWDDLLSRALLRSELLPCLNDPLFHPLFDTAAEVLENANDRTKPLFAGRTPKYHGYLQCGECGREIAHPPSQSQGTRQKYMHVCCPPEYGRGVNESLTIADCVSKSSGNVSYDERYSIIGETIDELVCSSGIPETYKKGRYFKRDATSPELNIDFILNDFFEKIIYQGESFKTMCKDTYSILGRRQHVLLSILIAFVVYVGPCKVGSTGSGETENGKLTALPRIHQSGSQSYPNDLFIRELPFAAMKFDNLRPCRASEGFLIAAGSLLGAVVNKRLEHPTKSTPETAMIYFAGLRTKSLWEHCLNHSRLHHDFGRRLLLSNGEESEGLSASSEEQEQPRQALSEDERQALEQSLALERQNRLDERQGLEQQLARERQSRLAAERRLEEERRANAEEQLRRSAEQQRRSAVVAEMFGSMQAFQQILMNDS